MDWVTYRGDRGSLGQKIHFIACFCYELAIWTTQFTCFYTTGISFFPTKKSSHIQHNKNQHVKIHTLNDFTLQSNRQQAVTQESFLARKQDLSRAKLEHIIENIICRYV